MDLTIYENDLDIQFNKVKDYSELCEYISSMLNTSDNYSFKESVEDGMTVRYAIELAKIIELCNKIPDSDVLKSSAIKMNFQALLDIKEGLERIYDKNMSKGR